MTESVTHRHFRAPTPAGSVSTVRVPAADRFRRVAAGAGMAAVLAALPVSAAETAPADPAKGREIAQTLCAACHGPDGNSALPANPKLAAQHPEYLVKQLKSFKAEPDKPATRVSPIMAGFAAQLDDAAMRNVAAWFSLQTLLPAWAENADLSKAGEAIYRKGIPAKNVPACGGCHGPTGAGVPAQYPLLSGQFAEYTAAQLTAFRQGTRMNSPEMTAISSRLSDREIASLAEYIAGLR